MKKFVCIVLSAAMILSLGACGSQSGSGSGVPETAAVGADGEAVAAGAGADDAAGGNASAEGVGNTDVGGSGGTVTPDAAGVAKADLKVGFLYAGDDSEGFAAAHYAGAMAMKEMLALSDDQMIFKWQVAEDESCYEEAAELVSQGCSIIFGGSAGFEPYMIQAAEEFPEVQFCHASGYRAKSSGLPNMHNYFTAVHESRYVSGIVAGMKLNEMIADGRITEDAAKIGYVGAFPYAEVISGYTAFFLGVRSVCPSAVMDVTYTNSWADTELENEAARALIDGGCVLLSHHTGTDGVAAACETAGIPVVGYGLSVRDSVLESAPTQGLASVYINWETYAVYAVRSVLEGTAIDTDWCGGYAEHAVEVTGLNGTNIAEGTAEKVQEAQDSIAAGTLHVFDTSGWTVNGEKLGTYVRDGIEYISEGYFHESEFTSAPSFDLMIDGIYDLTK